MIDGGFEPSVAGSPDRRPLAFRTLERGDRQRGGIAVGRPTDERSIRRDWRVAGCNQADRRPATLEAISIKH